MSRFVWPVFAICHCPCMEVRWSYCETRTTGRMSRSRTTYEGGFWHVQIAIVCEGGEVWWCLANVAGEMVWHARLTARLENLVDAIKDNVCFKCIVVIVRIGSTVSECWLLVVGLVIGGYELYS